MTETIKTFCRVCEPSCGLVASVKEGEITSLKPDKSHPVTKGFACHKGLAMLDIHKDPDRLSHPLKRTPEGLVRVSWETACTEIAERLNAIKAKHGDQAIGSYTGNPLAFNSTAGPAIGSFIGALGCRRRFGSGTQDCTNKFAASEAVYGSSTIHPIPDINATDFLLILGANPRISHMSFISIADPMGALRSVTQRGGRLVFVDPRETESIRGLGGHLAVKPDTDSYLLAAMIDTLFTEELVDQTAINQQGRGVEELKVFTRGFSAERVASVVGVSSETIKQLARDFAAAPSASIYMSTGVNMGQQGAAAYWLLQMLSLVSGNLDRPGGNRYGEGFYPAAKAGATRGEAPRYEETAQGLVREIRGNLPGNLMADMILDDPDPIRAMVVISGNPLISVGQSARLQSAFKALDFVVLVDIYPNATSEVADYILPATDMFERSDINLAGLGLQHDPFVQYTAPIVSPRDERKPEWQIMGMLERALAGEPFQEITEDPLARMRHMLRRSDIDLEDLEEDVMPVRVLPRRPTGEFFERTIQTDDQLVDCFPDTMADSRTRMAVLFEALANEPPSQLKMISRRTNYMLNSWFHNVASLKRPSQQSNPLFIHPHDAESRQIQDGDRVRIHNEYGELEVEVAFDNQLRPGVVAMTHGWGQRGSLSIASKHPGVNANVLLPGGPGSYDPFSNQSFMTGIPVEVAIA